MTHLDRRDFVRASALMAYAAFGIRRPPWAFRNAWVGGFPAADLVLRNAVLYDGTGAAPFEADVAITRDRISAVGPRLAAPGAGEVDLKGLALAPGFIDVHSHTDLELLIDPAAESKVRQGVTTEVTGQDGGSIGPWTTERAESTRERYQARYGVEISLRQLTGFFRQLERRGAAVNLSSMVGHGTVRGYVVGNEDRPATPDELSRMQGEVTAAIKAGACGLSSGLEYLPGAFADLQELVALAAVLRGTGLPYASHMRNEDDQLFAAVEEAINVGRLAGVPVQISHLKAQGQRNWWKAQLVLDALEAARADGVDVTYDRYPYVAYSTGLDSLFPVWSREGGTDALLERLDNPDHAGRIEEAVRGKIALLGSWDAVQITSTASEDLHWARGRRLGELAAERGREPYALLVQLVTEDRNRSGMVGFGMSEENTARFLAHPLGMVCSDGSALDVEGPLAAGTPHPRNYGTFPRVLGHYCRDAQVMPLETGIHKMTGMPAARLRLDGRGVIAPGAFADLVAFDPDGIADRATFEHPHQYPVGIVHVMVNGEFVLTHGERTDELPGRILRPTA
ncbi:MAG: amidohydrolase family protein [Gemmatimonadales bacterium]|nr:amidohydrolase family protein [Gemmatimonadales bacterium]NIN10214.1 amidohydrolase family protein [Gemmatimonadales bacterium]NIN48970.1 amidohydrolase family protein [Gemmatimonadales bacterium]NIP06434.1 amidohydrolase family protein [Gemmatimonadales bacterium]NIQ98786.1 amidohydrolase family protein [Gemmatimonadales bacterium]